MHHRRARPTIRLLTEDLSSGWDDPYPQRAISRKEYDALHPVSELKHPIVRKAAECIGADPDEDQITNHVRSCTKLSLIEIRMSQWRGGVWEDPNTGVNWLVVAGLAKGEHQDHEDFYRRVGRESSDSDLQHWLPTSDDMRLLKRETAARLMTVWELDIQRTVFQALADVCRGAKTRLELPHPVEGNESVATLALSVTQVREDDYQADEIEAEIVPNSRYAGSNLLWQLTLRILISIDPPEQGWDRYGDNYTNIGEPGRWVERSTELSNIVAKNELCQSQPGTSSHYTHRKHVAGGTIEGTAVRAMCGVFFVPTQDHAALPVCHKCDERYQSLPR